MNNKINIAYIDGANLDKGIKKYTNWELDYGKFRVWLKDKYNVDQAFIFIGLIPEYSKLYKYLIRSGFILIYKEVIYQKNNRQPKGNCDTDLIMKSLEDYYRGNLNKAVIISSDGDYAPLIKKFIENNCLSVILSPAPINKCSILLKRTGARIAYISDQKNILQK